MAELWYALHVKSRFEKLVETQLEHKGYEAFTPTYTTTRVWSDRLKSLSMPLFPGYVFSRFDIRSRLPIVVTPGVQGIVGAGMDPVAVEDREIDSLRQLHRSGRNPEPWVYVHEGQRVRVESGPLQGLTGIFLRTSGRDRLIVSITLLMRSVSVELDWQCVKPLAQVVEHPLTGSRNGNPVSVTGPLDNVAVRTR